MKDNSLINGVIIKAITGEVLTSAENELLDQWLADEENRRLFENLKNKDYLLPKLKEAHAIDMEGDRLFIEQKLAFGKRANITINGRTRQWKLFRDVATSAAAVLLLAAAIFLWLNKRKPDNQPAPKEKAALVQRDIAPGKTKALLTLADGHQLVLDSSVVGKLAQQGGAIVVNENGTLKYQQKDPAQNEGLFNTLSTANAQTYTMVLADGSKVWLNTGASIRYPVSFTGSERKVEITGEAYFEVAHNASKPFIVHVTDQKGTQMDVQVLGTHFNINAYQDETTIKTTLLEGSVKIVNPRHVGAGWQTANGKEIPVILKPGQQAQVGDSVTKVVRNANMEAAIAWKNGRFNFDNDDITVVMRQLTKWYDVEGVYDGPKPTQLFIGEMERGQMLSQVIKILEYTGVHFRIEGRKLVVMSKETYESRKQTDTAEKAKEERTKAEK
jgi:ferric-dicitrate binding protein FerR (iron transport regulator)